MGNSWRKISKTIFYLALLLSVIILIIFILASGEMIEENPQMVAFIFFGGILGVLVFFSLWGLALEFFDNVALIKAKICDEKKSDTVTKKINVNNSSAISDNTCECGYILEKDYLYCPCCGKMQV